MKKRYSIIGGMAAGLIITGVMVYYIVRMRSCECNRNIQGCCDNDGDCDNSSNGNDGCIQGN